jgi:gluconokinase
MMVGTSGAMRVVTDLHGKAPRIPPKLWCYRVDAERAVLGGALSNGGNLIEWLRTTLRLSDDLEMLEAALAGEEPDSHGLTFLPFLAGERSTGWHADARGTLSGMRLHTTPLDIMRAGREAVAYRFGLVHTLIRQALAGGRTPWAPVTASGAALLHSPAWMQMMADVLGHPVTASAVAEGSSRGAALLALEAIGAIKSIADVPAPLGPTYHPDRRRGAIYAAGAARQQALYEVLIDGKTPDSHA